MEVYLVNFNNKNMLFSNRVTKGKILSLNKAVHQLPSLLIQNIEIENCKAADCDANEKLLTFEKKSLRVRP